MGIYIMFGDLRIITKPPKSRPRKENGFVLMNKVSEKWRQLDKVWLLLAFGLLLTPFISALIISVESGTSIFRYDAWNTTWSDEPSYNITVREIREYITPQNVRSYNEVEPEILGYGTYRPTTYIPYVFASFFTGISSHNYFVYCNVLLVIFANFFFLWVVRPQKRGMVWLIIALSLLLPYQRYVWSGMIEASHVSMVICVIACGLYLFGDSEKKPGMKELVLLVSVILPLLYGTIRGYQFVFLLIPLAYILRHKTGMLRTVYTMGLIMAFLLCLYLYVSVLPRFCSPYYNSQTRIGSTSQFRIYVQNIFDGRFIEILMDIISKNRDAMQSLIEMIRNKSWHWVAMAEPVLIFCLLLYTGMKDKSEKRFLAYTYCVIILCVIEGVIMMNQVGHLYRYHLGIWVGGYYALFCLQRSNVIASAKILFLTICICIIVCGYGSKFAFPQIGEIDYNDEMIAREFSEIMPRDENEPWNNTIASGGNIRYLRYLYPSYISNSTCKTDVLEELINSDTLKSKYISLTDDQEELIMVCDSKYNLVFHDYGLRIYMVR